MKALIIWLCFIVFLIQNSVSTNTTRIYTKEYLRLISDKANNETIHKNVLKISDDIFESAYKGKKIYFWHDKEQKFTRIMINQCILQLKNIFIDINITYGIIEYRYYIRSDWD